MIHLGMHKRKPDGRLGQIRLHFTLGALSAALTTSSNWILFASSCWQVIDKVLAM